MPSCWFGLRIFVAHLRRFFDSPTLIAAIATATDKAMQAVLKAAPKTTNSPFAKTDPKSLKFSQGFTRPISRPTAACASRRSCSPITSSAPTASESHCVHHPPLR